MKVVRASASALLLAITTVSFGSSAADPPAGELTRELLRLMGARIESCAPSVLEQFPDHVVVCAVYPKTFSFFKLDWESNVARHELPAHPTPVTPWTKREGGYVREYDAEGTKVTVRFHDVSGRLLVAFIPPDTGDEEELPDAPAPARELGSAEEKSPKVAGFGGVTLPELIPESRVDPDFPGRLSRAEMDGWVLLSVIVHRDGSVSDVTVLRAQPAGWGLEEAATKAVQQWRYQPALFEGKPVTVQHTIRVRFERPDPA